MSEIAGISWARPDGRIFAVGDYVFQDRYPRGEALYAARVVAHCPCCHVVTLYDSYALDDETQPIFEPARTLLTLEEWERYSRVDLPADDGFDRFRAENPQLFGGRSDD